MRNVATSTEPDAPRICVAIDAAINDAFIVDKRFTNRYLAEQLGTSNVAVGRWRRTSEPTRDQLAELERLLDRPLGYISRLAGYIEDLPDVKTVTTELAIASDTRINDTYRKIILGILDQAITDTKRDRKQQAEWNKRKPVTA